MSFSYFCFTMAGGGGGDPDTLLGGERGRCSVERAGPCLIGQRF